MSLRTPSTTSPDTPSGPPTEPPYPWRLFVGMLLAILVGGAILAVSLGLNPLTFQRLGPDAQATPLPAALSTSGPLAAVPASTPPLQSTPVPPTAAVAQGPSQTTPGPAADARVQPPAAIPHDAAPDVDATSKVTATPPSVVVEPTPAVPNGVDPGLADSVVDAYIRYWDARAKATGDPFAQDLDAELVGVMAGTELAKAQQSVADFRADGRVYLVHVDHQIQLQRATPQEALVVDEFTSTARKIDPNTRVPVDSPPVVEHRKDAFLLRPIDGIWKVVDEPET